MNKEEIERILQRLNLGSELTPNEFCYLKEYIKDLQKKAELGDHYKHLYSEVKKQKDDVVELIKKIPFLYSPFKEEVLRMLGEIE